MPATLDWTGMQQKDMWNVPIQEEERYYIMSKMTNIFFFFFFWPEEYAFKELFARPCEKSSRTSPSSEVMSK